MLAELFVVACAAAGGCKDVFLTKFDTPEACVRDAAAYVAQYEPQMEALGYNFKGRPECREESALQTEPKPDLGSAFYVPRSVRFVGGAHLVNRSFPGGNNLFFPIDGSPAGVFSTWLNSLTPIAELEAEVLYEADVDQIANGRHVETTIFQISIESRHAALGGSFYNSIHIHLSSLLNNAWLDAVSTTPIVFNGTWRDQSLTCTWDTSITTTAPPYYGLACRYMGNLVLWDPAFTHRGSKYAFSQPYSSASLWTLGAEETLSGVTKHPYVGQLCCTLFHADKSDFRDTINPFRGFWDHSGVAYVQADGSIAPEELGRSCTSVMGLPQTGAKYAAGCFDGPLGVFERNQYAIHPLTVFTWRPMGSGMKGTSDPYQFILGGR